MIKTSPDDGLLDAYDYADDAALQTALHGRDKADIKRIYIYGADVNHYGRRLLAHQNRVAKDGANFLRHLGYSDRAARNFRAAMLFHDIGKINEIYKPALWTLEDRPTSEQKHLQRRHARLGADMFEGYMKLKTLTRHPHYEVRYALTRYHHERMDRHGPEGIDVMTLPRFVQISCIVDAYDGDRIWRPHQDHQRTPQETLERMTDPQGKYKGAFDATLLAAYIEMKMK